MLDSHMQLMEGSLSLTGREVAWGIITKPRDGSHNTCFMHFFSTSCLSWCFTRLYKVMYICCSLAQNFKGRRNVKLCYKQELCATVSLNSIWKGELEAGVPYPCFQSPQAVQELYVVISPLKKHCTGKNSCWTVPTVLLTFCQNRK